METTPKLPSPPKVPEVPAPPKLNAFAKSLQDGTREGAIYAEVFDLVKLAAERHAAACIAAEGRGEDLPSFESSGAAEVAAIAARFAADRKL